MVDSDSMRSREIARPKISEVRIEIRRLQRTHVQVNFGIARLMEDLDSGQGGEEEYE